MCESDNISAKELPLTSLSLRIKSSLEVKTRSHMFLTYSLSDPNTSPLCIPLQLCRIFTLPKHASVCQPQGLCAALPASRVLSFDIPLAGSLPSLRSLLEHELFREPFLTNCSLHNINHCHGFRFLNNFLAACDTIECLFGGCVSHFPLYLHCYLA